MAATSHERVGKALDLLKTGLGPFVEREVQGALKAPRVARFVDDLRQVHLGEGIDEYRHPAEFFRRTHLTESLQRIRRSTCRGGDAAWRLGATTGLTSAHHVTQR